MKKAVSLASASLVALTLVAPLTASASVPGVNDKMEGATQGIVAASHPLAAEAGKKILAAGGNAVDAAAAVQMALNVVEPMMSGIGGGGFMMYYNKAKNEVSIIDAREMAPQAVTPQLFLGPDGKPVPFPQRHTNGKAVGVPGTLLAVETALKKYGTMPLSQVIDPAIHYADKGVPVNWATASYIKQNVDKLQRYGTAGNVFVPNGKPLQEGDTLKQPDLAKTLQLIKSQGSDALYKGEIGQALVAEVQKDGGSMTTDDLKKYAVKDREAVRGTYRGYEIASMSPPSSGGLTLLEILKLMEGYDVTKMGPNSTEYLHRLIEASHLAFADRAAYLADEDYKQVPKKGLLDDRYIAERRQLINPLQSSADVKAGDPWKYEATKPPVAALTGEEPPHGQTTHFSIIDKWGNMVAYTTTIEQVFGSGIMVPGYGFMLNNEMTDFDAVPGGVNQVEPGKRPLSSMSPTLVMKDGKPFMALGSPGGPTIILSVAQTIMNVIDFNMPIQQAIEAPTLYSSSYPNVMWDPGLSQDVRLELMARGHVFDPAPRYFGCVQATLFDAETGKMYGGADNTRQGAVRGVDAVNFTAQPAPDPGAPTYGAFRVKVNGAVFPYESGQVVLQEGRSYVLADQLLKGLGAAVGQDFAADRVNFDGKTYLPVRKTAASLDYIVDWDAKEAAVLLKKARQTPSSSDLQKYYDEDKYKATN